MSIRLEKPWLPLTHEGVASLPGQLGVFEIGEASGEVVFIGYAGGRSRLGLRSELERECARRPEGYRFRYEITVQYLTRWQELLMIHEADHGVLPSENERPRSLGRLQPD